MQSGDVVWIYGPFPCSSNLKNRLAPREKSEADNGHQGEPTVVRTPNTTVSDPDKRAKTRARARHETINKRFKQ